MGWHACVLEAGGRATRSHAQALAVARVVAAALEVEVTNTAEHDPVEGPAKNAERLRIQPINFDDTAGALQSMIAQAEALLSACRLLVAQARDVPDQVNASSASDRIRDARMIQDKIVGQRAGDATPLTEAKKARKRPYTRYNYLNVDVDLLQIFKSRLPDLGIGPLVVLITLLENHGRMVPSHQMRAAIGTDSRSIIKVYVSRLRNLFRSRDIDVEISVLHGGYGVPRDCTRRIMVDLGFEDTQISTALRFLHVADNQSDNS